jgi:ABC-2 type transport system permease protein
MSTALAHTATLATTSRVAPLRVTHSRVLLSEWTKFRSLRSTLYTLLVAVGLQIGLGALFAGIAASQPRGIAAGETAASTSLTGTFFAQLAIGVLGVLMISGEYGTGMIRASLTVVPGRLPVLWAKLAVFAAAVFATTLIAALAAFLTGQALLSERNLDVSLSDPGVLRSILGAALYLSVAGLTGLAIGALLRNAAAAISTFVGVFFVIPPLMLLLPASLSDHVVQYLPSNAGAMLLGGTYGVHNPLAPWTGFAVMCCCAAVLIGLAGWRLRRVDA